KFAIMGEKRFVERWTLNRRAGWVDSNYYEWVQESNTQLWYSYLWYVKKYVEVLGVNWEREAKDIRKEYDEEIQKAEQKYKEATLENFYARCAKTSPYYETYILPKENKKREDYLLRYRATEEML